jgi:parvulin-like peptidyl-prolyl isomerase
LHLILEFLLKLTNRFLRLALIASAVATVSVPLLNQVRKTRGADPIPVAPAEQPKGVPLSTLPAVPADKVVLTVGDLKVTAGEFNAFVSELDPTLQARVAASVAARRQLGEQFVDLKLMAAEAKRQKLEDSPRVRTTYEQLLANALMMSLSEQTDANKQFYNENKDYFAELQARHILIGVAGSGVSGATLTDDQARAKAESIKQQLDKGADFATLARNESSDKGSAPTGGSLGMMSRGQMVPAFEKAAFSLKDKEISQPIKTQYGYHIIQVLERSIPPYKDVMQRIPQRRMELLIEQLKKSAKPQLDDAFFGPGESPQADAKTGDATKPAATK